MRQTPTIPASKSLAERLLFVWVLAMVCLWAGALSATEARATPTIGGGDCWKAGTPLLCRVTWQGSG